MVRSPSQVLSLCTRCGRMPGFEPELLRLQPGVLPMSYIQLRKISPTLLLHIPERENSTHPTSPYPREKIQPTLLLHISERENSIHPTTPHLRKRKFNPPYSSTSQKEKLFQIIPQHKLANKPGEELTRNTFTLSKKSSELSYIFTVHFVMKRLTLKV